MKIVHVISSLKIGGAETMLVRLIRGLPQHTHVVISLTAVGPLGEVLKASGYTVNGVGLRAINRMVCLASFVASDPARIS